MNIAVEFMMTSTGRPKCVYKWKTLILSSYIALQFHSINSYCIDIMKAMLYSLLILYQLAAYCNTVCDVTGNESGDYTNLMSSLLIFFCLQLLEDH